MANTNKIVIRTNAISLRQELLSVKWEGCNLDGKPEERGGETILIFTRWKPNDAVWDTIACISKRHPGISMRVVTYDLSDAVTCGCIEESSVYAKVAEIDNGEWGETSHVPLWALDRDLA